MKCPTDGATLTMSERSGIEIDYCPECRGVWLDRGELDKILERARAEQTERTSAPQSAAAPPPPTQRYDDRYDRRYDRPYDSRYGQKPYRKKKENWLMELFD